MVFSFLTDCGITSFSRRSGVTYCLRLTVVEFFQVENIRRLLETTLYYRYISSPHSIQHFVAEPNLNTPTKEAAHSSKTLEQICDHICCENSESYYFINTSLGSPKHKCI